MSSPIRLLFVEDVALEAELEVRELKRAGLKFDHRRVDREDEFRDALREFRPDVIVSDFSMPHFDGMSALALARELAPSVPFIFVSGTIGEEYAIRALKSGATDYVLKTNLVRLPPTVERALQEARERSALMLQEQRIARLSRVREMLGAVNGAIVRVRERGALFERICRIAADSGGFAAARIIEVDAAGRARVVAAMGSDPGPLQKRIDEYNADPATTDSFIARALREARPVVVNSPDEDPRVLPALAQSGGRSLVMLPLEVEGRFAGFLHLHAREEAFFDQDEMRLLGEITSNVSFALELMHKQAALDHLAFYDPLTGLPNRRLFDERLRQAVDAARAKGRRVAVVVADLERFNSINEALGERAGDEALRLLAERMLQELGSENAVSRLGGDQFALILPGIDDPSDVIRRHEQAWLRVFGKPVVVAGRELHVTARAGIGIFPEDGADAAELLRNALAAHNIARRRRERYVFYAPGINARVSEQLELEQRLRRAVERGELDLHYQPKVDLASGRIAGVEALMRWSGPDGKPVPPARFVPVLEQTGLILEASRQALGKAAKAYRGWASAGLPAPRIAVNVSSIQLRSASFVEDVQSAIGTVSEPGVDLEITESLLMEDIQGSIAKLRRVRELGMAVSLDDFGTGYSSLAYLSRLPIDAVKIDRSFVAGMAEKADNMTIVSAILSLSAALRLKTIAEGVETEEQARLLRLLRCDQMQGYLYSPPVPREKLEAMLSTATPRS